MLTPLVEPELLNLTPDKLREMGAMGYTGEDE
jgi:hypothetical protein